MTNSAKSLTISFMDPNSVEALAEETGVLYNGNQLAHGTAQLLNFLPGAVKSIGDLALHAENDRTRLQAATFIVDRLIPKPDAKADREGAKSPFETLLGNVVHELGPDEIHDNGLDGGAPYVLPVEGKKTGLPVDDLTDED